MPDSNVANLTDRTAPELTDIVYSVSNPDVSGVDWRVSWESAFQNMMGDVHVGKSNTITGSEATTQGGYVVIGESNTVSGMYEPIVIGSNNTVSDDLGYGTAFPDGIVCIGTHCTVSKGRQVAVGHWAFCGEVSATALGTLCAAYNSHDVAVGRGGHTSENLSTGGDVCLGSYSNNHLYIGSSINHRWTIPEGTVESTTPSSNTKYLHGSDAYDDVDGTSTNIAGGDLVLAGGRGTGSGVGGSVKVQISRTGAAANTKNTLVDVAEFDDDNATDSTALLLWADGSKQRVTVGATDSGGSGFRVLRIPN